MSLFRFEDLPPEIKIIVSDEIVNEYVLENESKWRRDGQDKRFELKMKELSVISSSFTKSAQSVLFETISCQNNLQLEGFLRCIKLKPSLALLVREIKYTTMAIYISLDSSFADILGRCITFEFIYLCGDRVILDFQVLARTKSEEFPTSPISKL